ncbi:MAG: 30S ribosomal protein S17 [Deltaproteobacteria bacterium]|nr:30S ribosomal protein S17 [Deltaproteobacteria bacterium]
MSAVESAGEIEGRRNAKKRQGVVVSAKMNKTVVVSVERRVQHATYGKYVTVRKRYAVHDTLGCQVGDRVQITECRPLSKTKRWRVSERVTTVPAASEPAAE